MPKLHTPAPFWLSVLATPGAKVSVGVVPVSIAWSNVTATLNVPVPASVSVINRSLAVTSVTVGLAVSMATVSLAPVAPTLATRSV